MCNKGSRGLNLVVWEVLFMAIGVQEAVLGLFGSVGEVLLMG